MEIAVTLALILGLIAAGALLIHRLNAQHDERIANFRYSGVLPWRDSRSRKRPRSAIDPAGPLLARNRREQPHGDRGRRRVFSGRRRWT
ncbi:hypothetical protein BLA24_24030 [Streptomyces cinnamoneus]|uniref:Uncharacterized protein n=1 Tax=Streptomyces cinnamoneus TaxID=53446 RepID=A0A2G1XD24_STRCJ|nr:hypothetical protein [Streptomyces cinnamoneus]PHQ49143.1 hypothetical protein BLA24_24030 [Streptomyces cinnamoneus]PPT15207.1 hypothetical protein CYQ11_22040 [Streptomyces cinnamoneus]